MNSGEVFLQEFFEEGPISNIILYLLRSWTRTMMKQKGKMPIKEQVLKLVKKETNVEGKWMPENVAMNENGL